MTSVAATTHFPFLTCQWKCGDGDEGHPHATLQGARDGACIVNYNHAFLEASGLPPSVVDTCHFSVTCDMESVKLWVHWRASTAGEVEHHMKRIGFYVIRDDQGDPENPGVKPFRARLRNILEWAQGPRLARFHSAIARLTNDRQQAKRQKTSAS